MGNYKIFNRPLVMLTMVIFNRRNWLGLARIFSVTKSPIRFLIIYLSLSDERMGSTDFIIRYRYKGKSKSISVRGAHDYSTFFEVFCRKDYAVTKLGMVMVDIGSNIGITARFFLENGAKFIYLYEPDKVNLGFLRRNIANFTDCYVLEERAVSTSSGTSFFEFEKTGRYGRLDDSNNLDDGIRREITEVEVIGIEDVLATALVNFDSIDLLKIDVEGIELDIVKAIPANYLSRIKMIQYETWPEGIVTLKPE
jgi:FkbM family methyltransferase